MLDPLTALSVASSIVQFLEFSLTLCREGKIVETSRKNLVAKDLLEVIGTLKARQPAPLTAFDPLKKEEQVRATQLLDRTTITTIIRRERDAFVLGEVDDKALADLAIACNQVASELIACIEKVTVTKPSANWRSVRTALLAVWKHDRIENLVKTLSSFQQEIALRILVLINAKSDLLIQGREGTNDLVKRGTKEIVEIIAINSNATYSFLREFGTHLEKLKEEARAAAQARHEEIIAAILTFRNGETEVITRPDIGTSNTDQNRFGRYQRSMTIKEAENAGDSGVLAVAELSRSFGVLQKILDCLYFRQMTDRAETIAEAHQKTLAWVFCDPSVNHKPWSNFVEWLERGTGCYWISGKAGSGKSTLMKYVHSHVRTREALEVWAGKENLVMPSFFFWNLGSSLQKTQNGLLRSLLSDVLNQHQELIPSLFPGLCRMLVKHPKADLDEPSHIELKNAFMNLARLKSDSLKMCFFIDGIDEYDGDHEELIEFLTTISRLSSSHLKIVLSSRPIPACVAAFSGYEKLYLHDLTYNDMRLYVEDKIGKHPRMDVLKTEDSIAAEKLMADITDKASGVFLWVRLVVKSLVQGFHSYDRISDLRQRLDMLPADLERLYDHMLRNMSPLYRQQASHLFQILMTTTKVQPDDPPTVLQISFAEEEDPNGAVRAPAHHLSAAAEASRCDAVEGRLRSRCCGLIEVQDRKGRQCVVFLHKTVVEYLRLDKNLENIRSLAADGFDSHIALVSSFLYYVKTYPLVKSRLMLQSWLETISQLGRRLLLYAMLAERTAKKAMTVFVDGLDQIMTAWWSKVRTLDAKSSDCVSWTMAANLGESFLILAVRSGLVLYVDEKLDQNAVLAQGDAGSLLLHETVLRVSLADFKGEEDDREFSDASQVSHPVQPRLYAHLAHIILQHGADPMHVIDKLGSPWSRALSVGLYKLTMDRHRVDGFNDFRPGRRGAAFAEILRLFILFGANPNAPARQGKRSGAALDIAKVLFSAQRLRVYQNASKECIEAAQSLGTEITAMLKNRGAKCTIVKPGSALLMVDTASIGVDYGMDNYAGEFDDEMQDDILLTATEPPNRQPGGVFRFWKKIIPCIA